MFVAEGGGTKTAAHWPFLEMLTGGGNYKFGSEGLALRPNKANLNPNELLPTVREFYSYSGSLTTPPCSLGVEFFLLQTPIARSSTQLAEYDDLFPGATNRPLQPPPPDPPRGSHRPEQLDSRREPGAPARRGRAGSQLAEVGPAQL